MTVFISDARYGDRFIAIRKEILPSGKYPASALIAVAGFARPNMMVEIQSSLWRRNKTPGQRWTTVTFCRAPAMVRLP